MFQILIRSYPSIFASFLDSAILNNDIALYLFFLRREVVCANIHKILSLQHLQAIWILRAKQQGRSQWVGFPKIWKIEMQFCFQWTKIWAEKAYLEYLYYPIAIFPPKIFVHITMADSRKRIKLLFFFPRWNFARRYTTTYCVQLSNLLLSSKPRINSFTI